ncbi:MAG TPA: DMT family transporter [Candidatus Saccharimonadales bacterium]|nr:DMT family transporter [Candidatus Saccharimonadales bacterium]
MKKQKAMQPPLGASLVVFSSLIYASYGVWIVLMGDSFGGFIQAVLRSSLVIIFLLPIALWRKELSKIHWRRDAWLLAGQLISSLLIAAPLYYAVLKVGVGLGMGVNYAGIVLGAFLFGWLLNKERYTRNKWLSTALGILGLWLVFTPNLETLGFLTMGAALLSGLASGLNMVVNKKLNYSASQTAIMTWAATALANIPFVLLLNEQIPEISINWIYLVLFAIASLAASWTLITGLKLIEAGAAGILGLLEIVFGIVYGIVFFKEQPSILSLLGMAAIMAAAAIPYIQHYNSRKGTVDG